MTFFPMSDHKKDKELRDQVREAVLRYYEFRHQGRGMSFLPGQKIPYAGRVFDANELFSLVDASLDFWLTEGRFAQEFSEKIADFLGVENVILTNSGSSANLLALSALTSAKLGDKKLKPGDEVITVAAGFPSTVFPILQLGLIPVFVDVDIPTYNIDIRQLEEAITPLTRCIFLAHTLGNPFNVKEILKIAEKYNLWLVEDNCDAFGSLYGGHYTGTFGHLSTMSFYPAHHITTGEGGAVVTNDETLTGILRSFRDWGRDCYCAGGENNTCGKRFSQKSGDLPLGYDHKYVYSELGYNLKMTDLQAAIGAAQMDKLPAFCDARRTNFNHLTTIFSRYKSWFILPEATENSDPAWFSFIITLKPGVPFSREELVNHLNSNGIETRNLFAGNLTRQPALQHAKFRIAGPLVNTDFIMTNTFFIGTFPGMTGEMIKYIDKVITDFSSNYL
jgi:CDP-4-dehydro-6-deoxyglucose reductase, E1